MVRRAGVRVGMTARREGVSRRASRRSGSRPRSRGGFWRFFRPSLSTAVAGLVALSVVLSALGIGAQQGGLLLAVAGLCLLAGLLGAKHGAEVPREAWVFVALAAYCAFQAVPLPAGWVAVLSPGAHEVWSGALRAFREPGPRLMSLSLDPGASLVEALKWASYAGVLVASNDVRSRFGSSWLSALVFVSGGLVALVTLVHGVLDAKTIYGLYVPSFAVERWSRGPLLNSNNLAGYANLALFCGLSLWRSPRNPLPRWALAAGGVALVVVTVLSGSRAGVATLIGGLLILGFHAAWLGRGSFGASVGLSATALSLAVTAVAAMADERLYQTLFSADATRKLSVFRHTLSMIADFPLFGVGRGAFESAFSPYYEPPEGDFASIYAHAENLPLQVVSEWGAPVGGVALLVFAVSFARALWRCRRDAAAATLGVGIAVVLLQNFADLGLEIPALMIALSVVWAALAERVAPGAARSWGRVGLPVVVAVAVLVLGFAPAFHGVQEERAEVTRRLGSTNLRLAKERAELREWLRGASARHPAEPYFAFVTGLIAHHGEDQDPLPALGRALERSPYSGQSHLLLAHVLERRGARRQALLHLRLAARYDRLVRAAVIERAVAWTKDGAELASVLPRDPEVFFAACSKVPPSERRVACWKEYEALAPREAGKAAEALLALLEGDLPPCDTNRTTCEQRVVAELQALEQAKLVPKERVGILAARLRAVRGDARGAAQDLLSLCEATESSLPCHELTIELALKARAHDVLLTAVSRWVPLACTSRSSECASYKTRAGRWLGEAGATGLSLRYLTEAANLEPNVSRWLDVVEAALAVNSVSTARVAFDRARRFRVEHASEERRLSALEQRLVAAEGSFKRPSTN